MTDSLAVADVAGNRARPTDTDLFLFLRTNLTDFSSELKHFRQEIERGGMPAALQFLNRRTRYRYTGVYRLDGDMMRMICLHDRKGEDSASLESVPLGDSFCQFAMAEDGFETADSAADLRLEGYVYRGVLNSYFGLPLSSAPGTIYGTLCHFDFAPQQIADSEIEFLETVRPLLMERLA